MARIARAGHNTSGMLEVAMDGAMLRGDGGELRGVFQRTRLLDAGLTVHLTDRTGKVVYTTHPEFEHTGLLSLAVLVVSLGRLIHQRISGPLEGFGQVLAGVAEGGLRQRAQDQSRDELGTMGRALNSLAGGFQM